MTTERIHKTHDLFFPQKFKLTLKGNPICGAARPTPGSFLITATISSIIFWILSDPISWGSTSRAGSWRTGSPALTMSGKAGFFSPRLVNQPARSGETREPEDALWILLPGMKKAAPEDPQTEMGDGDLKEWGSRAVRNGEFEMFNGDFRAKGGGRRRRETTLWMASMVEPLFVVLLLLLLGQEDYGEVFLGGKKY